jgi:hypothetical protein
MNTPVKIGGFVLALAAVFAAALAVGSAVGPVPFSASAAGSTVRAGASGAADPMAAMSESSSGATVPEIPGGLMSSQNGYTLQLGERSLPTGPRTLLDFKVLGPDGDPVTDYQVAHDKELHLIVVRRDLTGFQHVHPDRAADGTWSVPLDLSTAGEYRVFADFAPAGQDGITLGADLAVAGPFAPQALPLASRTAEVDGYTVTLDGELVAGKSSELTLSVSRDGVPVTDLQPYLAAFGHLVALRDGDLAYLHVHPAGAPGDGVTAPGPGITFYASIPSAGDYGLFLDFQHNGVVHTAAFTAHADPAPAVSPATGEHTPAESPISATSDDGHGH